MWVALGIDAAWTAHGSTGVALVAGESGIFRVLAAEPSYGAFVERAGGGKTDGLPDAGALLGAARVLSEADIDVVAIDMPVSKIEFSTRREADQKISKEFGRYKAGTHSPSLERPGQLGRQLSEGFGRQGFPIATTVHDHSPALIEVYPHVALVRLMKCDERRKYKVQKSKNHWREKSAAERIALLLEEWQSIITALSFEIDGKILNLPLTFPTLASMKEYEDQLDAIISAWVGIKFLQREAEPFGDADAAIWVPCCD